MARQIAGSFSYWSTMNLHSILRLIQHKGPNQLALLENPDDVAVFEATQQTSHHIVIKTAHPNHSILKGRGWIQTPNNEFPEHHHHYTPIAVNVKEWKDLWGIYDYSDHTDQLMNRLPTGSKIVDIGTYHGKCSAHMISAAKDLGKEVTLYTIDPYDSDMACCPHPPISWHRNIRTWQDLGVSDMITGMIGKSLDRINDFKDRSLDHVHLDGDASKDIIEEEIRAWIQKLRTFGSIAGTNYSNPKVFEAVNKVFKQCTIKEKMDIWISFRHHQR